MSGKKLDWSAVEALVIEKNVEVISAGVYLCLVILKDGSSIMIEGGTKLTYIYREAKNDPEIQDKHT
jgi:hypothetical protein